MNGAFVNSLRLSAMTAVAFAALSAQAADMYSPRVSMKDIPVPMFTWSGFYAGVNSGYGWGAYSDTLYVSAHDATANLTVNTTSKLWTEGGFGGGQAGYNVQRNRFVFGLETDFQGAAVKGNTFSEAEVFPAGAVIPTVINEAWARSSLDWFGTVRGRLGYSAGNALFFGETLFYATGGFAYGGVRDSLTMELTSPLANANNRTTVSAARNGTRTGWVAGGGIEVALSPSWSAKAEYQYIDLGSNTLATSAALAYLGGQTLLTDTGTASVKIDHAYNTVRLGLNYRINQAPEPLPLK